jgi:hypothetical protein
MKANGRKGADQAIVVALAAGRTVQAAARVAGVGETTIYRRLRDTEFRRRVAESRAEFASRALGNLAAAATAAVRTLRQLLKADSEAVRLSAARSILELGAKLRESVELEQRIAALEARPDEPSRPR